MAENKKSFVMYADQLSIFEALKDAEAGRLIKHIMRYINDQNPETPDRITGIAFEPIKQQLKRDLVRWEDFKKKQADNGKKGGRPKSQKKPKNPSLISETQKSLNVNVTVNDNVNDTGNVTEKNIESETHSRFLEMHGKSISDFEIELLSSEVAKTNRLMFHKITSEKHDEFAKLFINKIKSEEWWKGRSDALKYFGNSIPFFKQTEVKSTNGLKPVGQPLQTGSRTAFADVK